LFFSAREDAEAAWSAIRSLEDEIVRQRMMTPEMRCALLRCRARALAAAGKTAEAAKALREALEAAGNEGIDGFYRMPLKREIERELEEMTR
ncbi:MAG: hypothetical protein HYY17_01500, partial [Planctomycetes bacterium]|nr:hypothetical protein [Planctomycetota bacterium]